MILIVFICSHFASKLVAKGPELAFKSQIFAPKKDNFVFISKQPKSKKKDHTKKDLDSEL
jgi:hypothetical protein